MIDIPKAEYWTNNIEVKFIISFHNSIDKQNFLKEYRKFESFRIEFYLYSKCRITNIKNTNMIICRATRDFNDKFVFDEILSKEIPF